MQETFWRIHDRVCRNSVVLVEASEWNEAVNLPPRELVQSQSHGRASAVCKDIDGSFIQDSRA
ncbi:MAG TPA: hypothetical protein VHA33_25630 [Candidatus Angelobacter sp.]|nr:hypothetical protein [Candidatus Angelobacter sp.]